MREYDEYIIKMSQPVRGDGYDGRVKKRWLALGSCRCLSFYLFRKLHARGSVSSIYLYMYMYVYICVCVYTCVSWLISATAAHVQLRHYNPGLRRYPARLMYEPLAARLPSYLSSGPGRVMALSKRAMSETPVDPPGGKGLSCRLHTLYFIM